MTRVTSPRQRAFAVASTQHATIHHCQARGCGLTDHQILGLARRGEWIRRVRGVYVLAGSPDTAQQRLWVAYLAVQRSDGVISHLSAAAELGLVAHPLLPHVTVPPRASAGSRVAKVHRSAVPRVDRLQRNGRVVTSASRTIVDCASLLDRVSLAALVDAALCRRLATSASVEAAASRIGPGRAGKALAIEVVSIWTPGIEPGSPAEVRALRRLAEEGILGMKPQVEVFDEVGRFVARIDLGDPATKRGFEYEGVEFHGPRQWSHDEPRLVRLRRLGWDIRPLSKLDLLPGERRIREIAQAWAATDAILAS